MRILGLDARRLGAGLIGLGLVGVVIGLIAAAALFATGIAAKGVEDRLVSGQASLAAGLAQASDSVGKAATATSNLQATVLTTQKTLMDAGEALSSFADTSDALAKGLGFSLLGQQPLADAAAQFAQLSGRLRTFAADSEALAVNLGANAADLETMSAQLATLQAKLASTAEDLSASEAAGNISMGLALAMLLGAALCAWVAALAAVVAWLGWRMRRIAGGQAPAPAA